MTNALRLLCVAVFTLLWMVACQAPMTSETNNTTDLTTTEESTPNRNPAFQLAVAPPIEGLDVPFQEYTIDAGQAQTLTTPTGTQLNIPADAFVNAEGKPVEGEVTIRYREFHTAEAIIASGIPMHEPETGDYMETAGMFEIRGEQGGSELFIRSDKDIRVDMASYVEGDEFNFYQLGPKDCRWKDKGTAAPTPNAQKAKDLAALNKKIDKVARQWRTPEEVTNTVFELDVDYSRVPALKAFRNVLWEYTGTGKNPEKNTWIYDISWEEAVVEQTPSGAYELTLTSGDQSFTTDVRPVLSGKDQEKALAHFRSTTAEEYERLEKERQEVMRRGELVRSFNVTDFGICNWDTWVRRQQVAGSKRFILAPQFDLATQDLIEENPTKVSYFHVTENQRSVVRYGAPSFNYFVINDREPSTLLAILPNGQVAMCSATTLASAAQATVPNERIEVEFITLKEKATSISDIGDLINQALTS